MGSYTKEITSNFEEITVTNSGSFGALAVDNIIIDNNNMIRTSGGMFLSASGGMTIESNEQSIVLDTNNLILTKFGGTERLRLSYSSPDIMYQIKSNGKNLLFKQYDGHEVMKIGDDSVVSFSSGFHRFARDVEIRFAHNGDNSVIVELPVKIPARSIITKFAVVPNELSDLGTHNLNFQLSATSGTAADSTISSGTEVIGAGATNQSNSDNTANLDVEIGSGEAVVLKKVFMKTVDVKVGLSADVYVYICNAGTGNGTINSTSGNVSVIIEYYGID